MQSRYDEADAQHTISELGPRFGDDLALRVYTSRLLGRDPSLVLHGGGNTSVKSTVTEIVGDVTEVVHVKGSGWDLATIAPKGFPACRLARLRRCCELPQMSDVEMVAELRGQMIDPGGPTPSVEALLHAFLPAKFVDHTHADAVLALVDQPGSEGIVREVFGDDALFVPYVMPGFVLARRVAELWRARVAEGRTPRMMILDKHGVFTWGETARESYERMIDEVTRAERWLADHLAVRPPAEVTAPAAAHPWAATAPILRGALARVSGHGWIVSLRATPETIAFSRRFDLREVSQVGCATPDHVIRTKGLPLVLDAPDASNAGAARALVEDALRGYADRYRAYFERAKAARGAQVRELDPWPRVLVLPGLGVVTAGKTLADAEIVADVYEHTVGVIRAASAITRYEPVSELDLFDVEYWSLEQAKLARGASHDGPLARRVALVTGAASGIGLATARALLLAGAHVVLTDVDAEAAEQRAIELGALRPGRVVWARCDVTSEADATAAVAHACAMFGGLDVLVSNAGGVFQGGLHTEGGDRALGASIELNLLGHQRMARAASAVMLAQGTGGALLFNASKSAWNQGPDFGPYAVAKAALLALMRQYAVDLGASGVRSSAVNADRVRTDLFGDGVLASRARSRGLSVDAYFTANLLARETLADDVAAAFVYLATAEATTGAVITVDGGNAAAFAR